MLFHLLKPFSRCPAPNTNQYTDCRGSPAITIPPPFATTGNTQLLAVTGIWTVLIKLAISVRRGRAYC